MFPRLVTLVAIARLDRSLRLLRPVGPLRAPDVIRLLELTPRVPTHGPLVRAGVDQLAFAAFRGFDYTRLSNGFSRKLENHEAAVALNYFAYNFIKIHRTLRVTPAMAAGVTSRLFDVSDLVALLVESESRKAA